MNLKNTVTLFSVLIFILFFFRQTEAQTFSNKVVGEKNADYADSLKNSEYPYALPILGQQATKAGFDLPYSAGLGLNYLWQKSDLIIDNLQIGFNNGPQHSLEEIVHIDQATAEISAINFRPDIWLFPFLNVYGIFAKAKSSTSVDVSIHLPDSDSWNEVANFSTTAEFDGTSVGFGFTPTIGVGGGWLALDMNFTWTDIDKLDKPAYTFIFGPRIGKAFRLKKQQAVAVWVGGFRIKLNTATSGSIPLNELFSTGELEANINNGLTGVSDNRQEVETWWNNLTPAQQNNPVNQGKYETANRVLDAADSLFASMSDAVDRINTSSVQYSLNKKFADMWNFIVGAQYQLNKHWMIRAEYGFVGTRNSFIGGLQYRFGL